MTVSLIATLHILLLKRGILPLYSGLKADTLSTLISSFLYFFFYSSLHKAVIRRQLREGHSKVTSQTRTGSSKATVPPLGAIPELLIGLLAGIASKGITLPISAVCVRQQLEARDDVDSPSLLDTLRSMHRESGFAGMFAALPPSIPLALLPSLTLYVHSLLIRLLPPRHRAHPPGLITFAIGATSNAIATLPLYPMILVKALSQSGSERVSISERIREDPGTLYKGLDGQLAKGVIQQGVMMLVKQR
jgi:hypothetical protein